MKLYHFTMPLHLPAILRSGYLKLTDSNVSFLREHAGPDVVWLVDEPELSAEHGLIRPDADMAATTFDKRRVRITVSVPDYRVQRWREWVKGRMSPVMQSTLELSGGGHEAADQAVLDRGSRHGDR